VGYDGGSKKYKHFTAIGMDFNGRKMHTVYIILLQEGRIKSSGFM